MDKLDWVSRDAQTILDLGDAARIVERATHPNDRRLVVDHSVPFAVLKECLFSDAGMKETKNLRRFLDHHFKRALITHAQHEALKSEGLESAMPTGWQEWSDPFARYGSFEGSISPSC